MIFPWFSYGFPIEHGFSYGFPMVPRGSPQCPGNSSPQQVTLEPPAGLKAGLYRTYSTMVSQELLDKTLGAEGKPEGK